MNPFLIYIWGRVDDWQNIFGWANITSIIVAAIATFTLSTIPISEWDEAIRKNIIKTRNISFFLTCIFFPIKIIMPDSKTVATMIILPSVIESKIVKEDLPDIYNMALDNLKMQFNQKGKAEKNEK